ELCKVECAWMKRILIVLISQTDMFPRYAIGLCELEKIGRCRANAHGLDTPRKHVILDFLITVIVPDDENHRRFFVCGSTEGAEAELETAVSHKADHRCVGLRKTGAHCGRRTKSE